MNILELLFTGVFGRVVVENTIELNITGEGVTTTVTVLALGSSVTLLLLLLLGTTIDAIVPVCNGPRMICGANLMTGGGDCRCNSTAVQLTIVTKRKRIAAHNEK